MIQIVNPLKMQWEDGFRKIFPDAVWTKKSIGGFSKNIFMWCDANTVDFINTHCEHDNNYVFMRRYEWYMGHWRKLDFSKVKAIIVVNDYFAKEFAAATGITPHVVYNAVSLDKWRFKERKHGDKIAIVGFINQKKNLPLAMQILAMLPEQYTLHLAGEVQDDSVMDYVDNLTKNLRRRVYLYGRIDNMDLWLEDKNYLLSTAISEGCPNNVIEAMAKGIKPVVHNWPGAREQFGEHVFDTVQEAVGMISQTAEYNSTGYRGLIETKFGKSNFERIKEIICT